MLLLAALFAADAQAACAPGSNLDALTGATRRGEAAFAAMDIQGLTQAYESALAVIPCLKAPVEPTQAAALHRLIAMRAFTETDTPKVMSEFHAARRLVPGYAIGPEVAPPGHPLLKLYERSNTAQEGTLEQAIPPKGGAVYVDGVLGGLRPTGVSSIVQVLDADNRLTESAFLEPGQPTPQYGPLPLDNALASRRHRSMTAATIASGALAVGFYGLAVHAESRFEDLDQPVPDDQLRALRTEGNAYFRTAVGAGLLTAGFGAALVFTW